MLGKTDRALLTAMEDDARLSYGELGERVGLSKTPCWARVRELERRGVIRGYRTDIDPAALGLDLHAFIQVAISPAKRPDFEAAVIRNTAVVSCHATVGDSDYLLHVLVSGIQALDVLLGQEISRLPGVQRLVTTVCTKAIKERASLMACARP